MRHTLVGLLVAAAASHAAADSAEDLKDLERKARGNPVEVATQYGQLFAKAQKKNDLVRERAVYRSFKRALGVSDPAVVEALMNELAPKRNGAFASAHFCAEQLLLQKSQGGAEHDIKRAAKVLQTHAGNRSAGKCAKAMADYARGMVAIADGKDQEAAAALKKALAVMVAEDWPVLAMHAGTELAALHVRNEQGREAAQAMKSVARTLGPKDDTSLSYVWRRLVQARLKDAPEEVLAPYEQAMKPHTGPRSVSAKGGAGGAGGHGGGPRKSPVGEALDEFGRSKPLFTVKRDNKGFQLRAGFDRRFKETQPYKDGVKHRNYGGVTVSFWGYGVALNMVDPTGRQGQPGEASQPRPGEPFYFLAKGETWSISKGGVSIK